MIDGSGEVLDGSSKGEQAATRRDFLRSGSAWAKGEPRSLIKVGFSWGRLLENLVKLFRPFSRRRDDDQTSFRFAFRAGQWAKIAI